MDFDYITLFWCERFCDSICPNRCIIHSYLNQFTQPDTIVPDPSNPQDWNRYSYVTNNPVKYNDPSGHAQASDDYEDHDGECDSDDKGCNSLKKKIEGKKQLNFCLQHPNYPECDIPEQDTLRTLPIHFTPIFPWQLSHLDVVGLTGDITGCFIIICGTVGVSWVKNPKWGEDTIFFNFGGGRGLGWGSAGSVGGILAYDAPYNSDLAGLATNYGANVTVGQGGQITYAHSASPNVTGNYAQTYTASYSLGGEGSAHHYITNSIPLVTCIWGKNCK